MRSLALLLCLFTLTAGAQVAKVQGSASLQPANLTPAQRKAIRAILRSRMSIDGQFVEMGEHFPDGASFSTVRLAEHTVVLVDCCARAEGHNTSFWIFDLATSTPRLIGSPADKLGGFWKDVILPHTSHGFHDFVLGYGGPDPEDTTFRYDGRRYRAFHTESELDGK